MDYRLVSIRHRIATPALGAMASVAILGGVILGASQFASASSEGSPLMVSTFVDPNMAVQPYLPCLCPVCSGQSKTEGGESGQRVRHSMESVGLA